MGTRELTCSYEEVSELFHQYQGNSRSRDINVIDDMPFCGMDTWKDTTEDLEKNSLSIKEMAKRPSLEIYTITSEPSYSWYNGKTYIISKKY